MAAQIEGLRLWNGEALPPQLHIWTESKVGWFETADCLPRWKQGRD